jgi:hypothetical protein
LSLLRIALVAALAAFVLPASASGAFPRGEVTLSTIKLEDSGGHEVEVSSARVGSRISRVAVSVVKEALTASYSVPVKRGAAMRATFGSLGALDVRFQRRRKEIDRPEPNCRWITETGVFRGTFDFAGEGGYLTVHAVDPVGEVFRLPDGFCGLESFRSERPPLIPGLYETVLAARTEDDTRLVNFEASRTKQSPPAFFAASLNERIGSMTVERTARARGARGSFSHTKASRASVFPPAPFSGSATFSDPAAAPPTWTGSLSVSFLGAPDVPLAGETFIAKLCPRLPFLRRCLRPQRDLYGSGSHSQPLALARLSSLR